MHLHLNIQRVPVRKINPAPYNPRKDLKPGDPEYEKLRRSMDEFGCVEPLVWNKRTGHLVGGHQRFKVLRERGETQIDVSVVDLPLEREKALNIALNKISGSWDDDKLAALLEDLIKVSTFDIETTGFDLPEANALISEVLARGLSGQQESFDVDAELARAKSLPAVTKPGDVILLGRDARLQHRLVCGDCTDEGVVRTLMGNQRAVLFATDPPYLVDYDGTNHPGKGKHTKAARTSKKNKDWSGTYGVTWDDADANPALYEQFIAAGVKHAIRPNAGVYIWHASRRQPMLDAAMVKANLLVHCQIIWVKNRSVLTRSWYGWQHEPCLMGWPKGCKPPRMQVPMLSTVWKVDTLANGPDRPDHPTPKPLELFEIPIQQHTRAGEVCYEPFAGSGTQIIAAQRLGRRCFAIEVSPVYCDLIVRRFIAFAGEGAVDPKVARKYRLPNTSAPITRSTPPSTRRSAGPASPAPATAARA